MSYLPIGSYTPIVSLLTDKKEKEKKRTNKIVKIIKRKKKAEKEISYNRNERRIMVGSCQSDDKYIHKDTAQSRELPLS